MMSKQGNHIREFKRQMLRAEFQSLFWNALLTRKRDSGFTMKALADKLGINKSYVSRSFSSPPNWTIDKLADMAEVLDLDLVVEARDRLNDRVYTSSGTKTVPHTEAGGLVVCCPVLPSSGSSFDLDAKPVAVSTGA